MCMSAAAAAIARPVQLRYPGDGCNGFTIGTRRSVCIFTVSVQYANYERSERLSVIIAPETGTLVCTFAV